MHRSRSASGTYCQSLFLVTRAVEWKIDSAATTTGGLRPPLANFGASVREWPKMAFEIGPAVAVKYRRNAGARNGVLAQVRCGSVCLGLASRGWWKTRGIIMGGFKIAERDAATPRLLSLSQSLAVVRWGSDREFTSGASASGGGRERVATHWRATKDRAALAA